MWTNMHVYKCIYKQIYDIYKHKVSMGIKKHYNLSNATLDHEQYNQLSGFTFHSTDIKTLDP